MEVSGQLHALAALSPVKEDRYPLDRGLCGPQNQYWRSSEEKKSPNCHRRESNPYRPARSLVSVLTKLLE
jgi:hypothetical protein